MLSIASCNVWVQVFWLSLKSAYKAAIRYPASRISRKLKPGMNSEARPSLGTARSCLTKLNSNRRLCEQSDFADSIFNAERSYHHTPSCLFLCLGKTQTAQRALTEVLFSALKEIREVWAYAGFVQGRSPKITTGLPCYSKVAACWAHIHAHTHTPKRQYEITSVCVCVSGKDL